MAVPFIKSSFAAGEVAPSFFGHVDNTHYAIGCSTARNAFVSYRGGMYSRAGTAFVGFSKQTTRGYPPRLITFQFTSRQGLTLEFGHLYMRVIQNGAFVTEAPISITAITRASPAVVSAANSYTNGDWVYLSGVVGMSQVNGQTYVISARTGGTFALNDVYGNPIDSTGFSAYTSGGTAARIYTLVTPWAEVDLEFLKFTQSADVMSLCCWNQMTGTIYATYDLARIANNNWTVTQVSFAPTIAPPTTINLQITHAAGALGTADNSAATYGYAVTAVNPVDQTESVSSPPASVQSANIAVTSGSVLVYWDAVPGASAYNIYKAQPIAGTTSSPPANYVPAGVLYGYVGTSIGVTFTDTNVISDFAQVPPRHTDPFAASAIVDVTMTNNGAYTVPPTGVAITTSTGSGAILAPVYDQQSGTVSSVLVLAGGNSYAPGDTITITGGTFSVQATGTIVLGPATGTSPSVVAYFQERRVYGGTPNQPDTYFMSQPGAFKNFDSRIPTIDSDAIIGTPWSQRVDGIQWMISMPGGLVVLTGGAGAWQLTGVGGSSLNPQPITPADQQAQPQAYNGAHYNIPPIKIDYEVFYVQSKGSLVRVFSYNFFVNIYTGTDITYLSSHLFSAVGFPGTADGILREWAWAEEPYKLLWVVREDGLLLSLTYLKAQEVAGWTRHDTLGQFRSIASVTELPVDAVYVATQRPIGPAVTYMIERMDNRLWAGIETTWCVDAGLALPQPTPAAILYPAASALGPATFFASANVFGLGSVGSVIRAGGGIATITDYLTPTSVSVNITTPIAQLYPDLTVPLPQPQGAWTMTAPVTQIGGLNHLNGQTVTGIADGVPIPPQVVRVLPNRQIGITLSVPATAVTVGLAFRPQVQSLYLDAGQPTIQGRRKKVAAATVRLEATAGYGQLLAGANQPDGSVQSPAQVSPPWGNLAIVPDKGPSYQTAGGATVTQLFTGDIRVPLSGGYDVRGQVAIEQLAPLPLQVLAFVPEYLEGDIPEVTAGPSRREQQAGNGRRVA